MDKDLKKHFIGWILIIAGLSILVGAINIAWGATVAMGAAGIFTFFVGAALAVND